MADTKKSAPKGVTIQVEASVHEDILEIRDLMEAAIGCGVKVSRSSAVAKAVSIALPAMKRATKEREAKNA